MRFVLFIRATFDLNHDADTQFFDKIFKRVIRCLDGYFHSSSASSLPFIVAVVAIITIIPSVI